ncbi:mCG1051058 [Mus musculus]|nr:mCG1051058 [Mus musculus]
MHENFARRKATYFTFSMGLQGKRFRFNLLEEIPFRHEAHIQLREQEAVPVQHLDGSTLQVPFYLLCCYELMPTTRLDLKFHRIYFFLSKLYIHRSI